MVGKELTKNLNVEAWDLRGPRGRRNSGMKYCALLIAVQATLLMGCDNESPTTPSPNAATVRFTYLAATALNPDLPASTQACVQGVGRTHIHPSWRNFIRIDMQAVGSDRWEISFSDVAVNERLSIRGMSRELLKLSGSLVHDYATISDDSPSPNRASRARRAATSAGIS